MPPVIFRFLNNLSSVQTISQGKNISETLIEKVSQMSTRHWKQACFAFTCCDSHYFFSSYFSSSYRRLNTSGSMDDIGQALANYRQQLNENTNTFMRSCIKGIKLLVGQPFSLEKIPEAGKQSIKLTAKYLKSCQQDSGISVKFRPYSNIPANIRTDIRNTMKEAGYHPDEEGMCYGLAWVALLACVRQDGQTYMQRMQYLAQMDSPPLPGTLDTHQIYPFFDAVSLSMTSYKNMSGYEKGIGYPGRQEVAFPGRVIGGHEPDYQVPVVKQTFIAECIPETFIDFLQQTRENNNSIPFGVMIHYPEHATSIGFDGDKWLATDHDNHYYTKTTNILHTFFNGQSDYYRDGRIIAAIEVVASNDYSLNITSDALVVNAKKSVSAPLALHLALQYGDVNVTADCITVIGQQAHTPEILLEQLTCKDAGGTPGLYMALQKGHADAITAFIQASTTVITALPFPEAQKAELLYRLFSSKNACLYPDTQNHPEENTGDRDVSRKRPPPGQTDSEGKRSRADAQNHPQETTDNSTPSRKRTSPEQTDHEAKRSKRSAVKGKRIGNTEPQAQIAIDVSSDLDVLKSYFSSGINDTESEAVKKLFQILNGKKIRIKDTFYKLLVNNVDSKDLPSFCARASVFFSTITDTVKDTGCLTSMLDRKKKYIRDFMAREDAELEYLAGLDTFRCFSSMNKSKGLPKKEEVEAVLDWEIWKPEGVFNLELFRAFSSMNNGKGLPKKEAVEIILTWDVWKPEGVFNMELFRAFSSMNHGKGLLKKEAVEDVLCWEVWKPEGIFSMELFRAFSSINNGKGLPQKEVVEDFLGWKIWKPNGMFSMELFRAFSSMNSSKGLPQKDVVEALLDWEVWKLEGVFSMELFRAFSSMNHGKGLPQKEAVEAFLDWQVWKPEGVFSMELFRAFSSMNNGKGLPQKEAVEAFLDWQVWKREGVFNLELLRAFSSMNNGKGLPQKEAVEAFLDWQVWKRKGVFSMDLFRAFSSMNSGKALPKKEAVEAVLDWVKGEEERDIPLFKLVVRLYTSEGIPDITKLKQYEQKLLNLFFADSTESESDDENRNKDNHCCLIKPAALFLSTRKPQYVLNFRDMECFYQQAAGAPVHKLKNLLKLLLSYGGQGVASYLILNDNDKKALLGFSSWRASLPLTMQAITGFSPQKGKLYLFFTRNLKAPPNKDQWNHLSLQLNKLTSVLKTRNNQRHYLEVIWNLAPSDRDIFLHVTHTRHVIAVFPSLSALQKLAKSYSQQKLKALLTACLRFKQGNPSGEEIKRLFAALLETRLPLCDHGDIPDYFLSGYTETGDAATFIPTPPTRTTEKLALYFVAAVTRVLSNMLYHYKAGKLKIEQYAGDIHFFPVPELEIQDKGIKISNWPMEVFQRFLAVTEFPEQYYLSQEEWLQYRSEFPLCFRGSIVTCHQEERAAIGDTDFQPFSIAMLTGLLKNNIPVKPATWKSFDYHKDKLPRAVHRQLLGEIEKATHEDIPISLIEYLKARRAVEELQDKALPQNRLSIPPNPLPISVEETLNEEEQFQRLWADLSRKTLLEDTDLQLLTSYKQYMTMEHIVKILQSAHASIAPCKLDQLRQLLGEKRDLHSRKDPFLLTLNDEITSYLMEAEI